MSEYSASAPVVQRKTLPKTIKPAALSLPSNKKVMPRRGFKARMTERSAPILTRPVIPKNKNHKVITGPNALPIREVPACCMAKSEQRMMMVIKTTVCWFVPISAYIAGMVRRPSMAVVTVTAGVRIPSARSAAPPIMAGIINHFAQRLTRLYRAKMPPSLWLSAFMAIRTYLTVVIRVRVQIMRESAPRITSVSIVKRPPLPAMIAFKVYIGLVPMSPYTIPSVTSTMPALSGTPVDLRSFLRPARAAGADF